MGQAKLIVKVNPPAATNAPGRDAHTVEPAEPVRSWPPVLNRQQCADLLDISLRYLDTLIGRGWIPHCRLPNLQHPRKPGKVRFRTQDVLDWISRGCPKRSKR